MFKNPGFMLVALGMTGLAFSLSYTVAWLPAELCLALSLLVVGAGIYLMIKRKSLGARDSHLARLLQIEQLQEKGEKIKITLDNCEVKSRSGQVLQTYIVFHKKYRGQTYKFISQPTLQSEVALRTHIEAGEVDLYIDKQNPTNYYFDWGM